MWFVEVGSFLEWLVLGDGLDMSVAWGGTEKSL